MGMVEELERENLGVKVSGIWWPGGKTVGKRLEVVQDRLGRKLLGAS